MTKSRRINKTKAQWTPALDAEIIRRYPHESSAIIAAELGMRLPQIYCRAKQLGVKKRLDVIAETARQNALDPNHGGRANRFAKGHIPANKGLRRPGWAPGNMAKTQFKKGRAASEARNYCQIGSLRINKDGYLERKITDDPTIYPARRWIPVHRQVWIESNGPVPNGHIVVFKKGLRTNALDEITLDRLECISLAENMRRNTFHQYGPEVAQVVLLRGAITRQINKRERKKSA